MSLFKEFKKGIIDLNPTFVLVLGLCPTLAVSTSIDNAIGMGISATFVLVCSNAIISAIRKFVPRMVRIPTFIVIIATFVTIVQITLQAYLPPLYEALGIYVPLIVVNCIILGRAEAFASKNPVLNSIADGIGIGTGFTFALILISFLREVLGTGRLVIFGHKIFELPVLSKHPLLIFILPPGAFLVIALILGLFRHTGMMRSE